MQDSKTFAKVSKTTLLKLYSKLNNPDYNFVIHTSPVKDGAPRANPVVPCLTSVWGDIPVIRLPSGDDLHEKWKEVI
jgi:hypothetical protein